MTNNVIKFPERDRTWKEDGEVRMRTAGMTPASKDIIVTKVYPVKRWFAGLARWARNIFIDV